jgi:hypothetical protein
MVAFCLQYASNAAAAEYLEKQTNETIPYDGFDWIELRVDSSTKQGAGEWGGGVDCCCCSAAAAADDACAVWMPQLSQWGVPLLITHGMCLCDGLLQWGAW